MDIISNASDLVSMPNTNVALSVYDIQHNLEDALKALSQAIDKNDSSPQVITTLQNVQQQVQRAHNTAKHLLNSKALGEFSRFNMFPLELRHQIWTYSLPEARIIEVVFDIKHGVARSLAKAVVPATLQVCQESRQIGLKTYSGKLQSSFETDRFFRFDPRRDTIYLIRSSRRSSSHFRDLECCLKEWRA